jgi:hypothetical protein
VVLSSLVVRRARQFGACWVGCKLWKELELVEFWHKALGAEVGAVPWEKDRFFRALDRMVERKKALEKHLAQRWKDLFGATPRAQLRAQECRLLEGDWQSVSAEVDVQLIAQDNNESMRWLAVGPAHRTAYQAIMD